MRHKKKLPPLPDVSVTFFEYASGLSRDGLQRLSLTRWNTIANMRDQIKERAFELRRARRELKVIKWLVSDAGDSDAEFLHQVGISDAETSALSRMSAGHGVQTV